MFSIASLVSWSTKKQKYKFGCPQCYALGAVLVTFCSNSIWKVSRMMNEAGIGGSCDCMICYYFALFLLALEFLWCSAWLEWFLCRQGYINVILSVGSPHVHIKNQMVCVPALTVANSLLYRLLHLQFLFWFLLYLDLKVQQTAKWRRKGRFIQWIFWHQLHDLLVFYFYFSFS